MAFVYLRQWRIMYKYVFPSKHFKSSGKWKALSKNNLGKVINWLKCNGIIRGRPRPLWYVFTEEKNNSIYNKSSYLAKRCIFIYKYM
jgi:hypothetical protein